MGRLHLIEWEDQPWFPAVLRDAATAYLRRAAELSGFTRAFVPHILEALRSTGATRIVDLCSGGGGPMVEVAHRLREAGADVPVVLTDLYPNAHALEEAARAAGGGVTFAKDPVDATAVPAHLGGMRTLFNAFHHFRPAQARAILADAVACRQPILIFEIVAREPLALAGIAVSPLFVPLAMPTIRPVRAAWLFFTYIVPLVPLLVGWDGLVSCVRVYSQEELRALVASLPANDFSWEIGRIPLGPMKGSYLVGRPGGR